MRKLTIGEINECVQKNPGCRQMAVENFLGTVTNCRTVLNAYGNLSLDSRLYKWNDQTVRAIQQGIDLLDD